MSSSGLTDSFLPAYDAASDGDKVKLLFAWIKAKPDQLFSELRAQRPILVTPGPVLLTRFADVEEALSRDLVFTVRPYAPKMDPSVGPFMLARDGTVYNQRDKGIMRALIQQSDLAGVRQQVVTLAGTAIKRSASADGRLEIVGQVTRLVPVQLTGSYFGFPGPDVASMMRWSRATQDDMFHNLTNDPAVHRANLAAGQEMMAYLSGYLAARQKQVAADPTIDDITARLLRLVTPSTIGFDTARMITNIMGLLVGGVETTSAAVVQAIDILLDRPDALKAAIAAAQGDDSQAFDRMFWEALRFWPINPFVMRLSVESYIIAAGTPRETTIPANSVVLCATASAMRDGTVVKDPEAFVPSRPDYHYFHLGYGSHRCLGDQVSLRQAPELARQLFRAGFTARAEGAAGRPDFRNGSFPESFTLVRS